MLAGPAGAWRGVEWLLAINPSATNHAYKESAMKKRALGSSGLHIAPLAFGGNVFGWTVDEARAFALLDAFVGAGCNLVDTADVYSRWVSGNAGGESETIIGRWLKKSGKRDKVVIVTKVGMEMGPSQKGLTKAYIVRAIEDSLQRLQTDYVDLYLSHTDDTTTPFEETFAAFEELIGQGKVRAIGASNYTATRLKQALQVSREKGLPRYQVLEPLYNLYDRDYEKELEPLCRQEGLGVITYSSLASGFLTGKYLPGEDVHVQKSVRFGFVQKCMNERGLRIVDTLRRLAQEQNTTPSRLALAWLISRPSVTAPIASATSLEQLNDLLGAIELTLDQETLEALNQASK